MMVASHYVLCSVACSHWFRTMGHAATSDYVEEEDTLIAHLSTKLEVGSKAQYFKQLMYTAIVKGER